MGIGIVYKTMDGSRKEVRYQECPKAIMLEGRGVEHAEIQVAGDCRNLQVISLAANRLSTFDLSVFTKFPNLRMLNLGQNLFDSLDLSPLSQCMNLVELNLNGNWLSKITLFPGRKLERLGLSGNLLGSLDLSPLGLCREMKELRISENMLTDVDLTPISQCGALMELGLHANRLRELDLTPLGACISLEILSLNGNSLTDLDISSLHKCLELRELHLVGNPLNILDVTSILSCHNLSLFSVAEGTSLEASYLPTNPLELPPGLSHFYGKVKVQMKHAPPAPPAQLSAGNGSSLHDKYAKQPAPTSPPIQESMTLDRALKLLIDGEKWNNPPPILAVTEKGGGYRYRKYDLVFRCVRCGKRLGPPAQIKTERKWFRILGESLKLVTKMGESLLMPSLSSIRGLSNQAKDISHKLRDNHQVLTTGSIEELEIVNPAVEELVKTAFKNAESLHRSIAYDYALLGWIHRNIKECNP